MSGGWSGGSAAAAGGNPETEAGGRLTLTSGTAVTTADVTGATTIYYTPYKHDRIGLYDGSSWDSLAFTETSLALGAVTSGLPYDVFGYDSSGTLALEKLAWTNGTTRATALTRQNGVWCKTGALTRRYLGTFYTTSTTATEDSRNKRFVFNADNRVLRVLWKSEATLSWTYGTATIRQANGAATNQVEVIVGLAEEPVEICLQVDTEATANHPLAIIGIGENSVTAWRSTQQADGITDPPAATRAPLTAHLIAVPAVGYSYYSWLEYAGGSTQTFYGTYTLGTFDADRSGLYGTIRA